MSIGAHTSYTVYRICGCAQLHQYFTAEVLQQLQHVSEFPTLPTLLSELLWVNKLGQKACLAWSRMS
jgi:hypothetical protein